MADDLKTMLAELDSKVVLLDQANRGDHLAAEALLEFAIAKMKSGGTLSQEVTVWIAQGLEKITNGTSGKAAFRLSAPRGKPPRSEEFQRLVAESIHHCAAGKHKALSADGETMGAYEQAAEFFDISANTAAAYYQRWIEIILAEEQINRELSED